MRGPVVLRHRGRMAEKLIDRARAEGIAIDAAERVGPRETILRTGEAGAARLMALAERFGLDMAVVRVGGLPRLRRALMRRAAMALSLVIFLAALALLSGRAWLVEVRLTGAEKAGLERAMQSAGVRVGMRLDGLDAYQLSQRLLSDAGGLAYVGVRRQGVRLLIEAVGEDAPPPLYDPAAARDIRATRDGVVEEVTVLYGAAAVKPGDSVMKGQTLIRGEEKVTDELTRGVAALGSVVARVWTAAEAEAPLTREEMVPTGRERTERALVGPGFSLPLVRAEAFSREETQQSFLPIGGIFAPLGVMRTRHAELETRLVRLDEAAVKREISENALAAARAAQTAPCTEIDKWVDYSMIEGEKIRARAVVEWRMNIAG